MRSSLVVLFGLFFVGVVAGLPAGALPPGAERAPLSIRSQLVGLGVPTDEVDGAIDACRDAGFTSREAEGVLRLVARARLAGLPHEDLLHKLHEGLAKGASPEAIEAALRKKATLLNQAKGLVDRLVIEGWSATRYELALQVVADALEAGGRPGDILRAVRLGGPVGPGLPDVAAVFTGR